MDALQKNLVISQAIMSMWASHGCCRRRDAGLPMQSSKISVSYMDNKLLRRIPLADTLTLLCGVFMLPAALCLASCSSDRPQWADPEAHEKPELLRKQYTPVVAGTWHIESVKDKGRFFERLTLSRDGTLSGQRKWQSRQLVTIDGKEQYTDWQDVEGENGTFSGTWQLSWSRDATEAFSGNRLVLTASFDDERPWPSPVCYSLNARFISADETTLCIAGGIVRNGDDGSTIYTRGDAEPGF